jgi:hypothetical protein
MLPCSGTAKNTGITAAVNAEDASAKVDVCRA